MSTGQEEKTTILVHVTVKPEDIPKFLEAFHTCFQECKNEPELERFEVFGLSANEGEFYWIETWRGDKEWFCNV
jgi:quinol monooxygenase YgiN